MVFFCYFFLVLYQYRTNSLYISHYQHVAVFVLMFSISGDVTSVNMGCMVILFTDISVEWTYECEIIP